jgi:hypothetical protein
LNTTSGNIINYFAEKPARLFLADAFGAALSTILLVAVLGNFSQYFGISQNVITVLSAIAILLCMYSSMCYKLVVKKWAVFIAILAWANLLYCFITAFLILRYFENLTVLGISYFLIEITIIGILVCIEFKVAKAIKNNAKRI